MSSMSNDTEQDSEINSKNYTEKISCSKETKLLLMNECIELYMKHHPEMKGKTVTQGHIERQVIEFYLKAP